MRTPKDLTGCVFNQLTVVSPTGDQNLYGKFIWECRCSCGASVRVTRNALVSGTTMSCGCAKKHHGHCVAGRSSRTYSTWKAMVARCRNPSFPGYSDYGGRGITVCSEWLDFTNFLADMGDRPAGRTLDRRDNDGPYTPDNCRWATPAEQSNNRRTNRVVEFQGRKLTTAQWSREVGLSRNVLFTRLSYGWSVERALTTKVKV